MHSTDAVLQAITEITQEMKRLDTQRRLLFAYARHTVHPRPYTLQSLASAADMSISGVRTAYTADDIERARHINL